MRHIKTFPILLLAWLLPAVSFAEQEVKELDIEYRRGETIGDLLARAEQGLHEAIQGGGNQVHKCATGPSESAQILEMRKLKS